MPSTIDELFSAAGADYVGVVKWGASVPTAEPGVYIVSLTNIPDNLAAALSEPPLSSVAFEQWLLVCHNLMLDGTSRNINELMARISGFWIKDEVVVYIGKATSLSKRVGAYYRTPLGADSPHAGGYFVKLLSNLNQLWVHFATCGNPKNAEDLMLGHFCTNVSDISKKSMHDPAHPFPFANLEWPKSNRKKHGLSGVCSA